ncbi:MAG: lysophospholipid acyltransferase family protein [bacterium]|nr:lysophospholipid acyltransferase family protein [bacterium]
MEQSQSYHTWQYLISHYMIAMCIGIPLGTLFLFLVLIGRIRIKGYLAAIRLAARGKVIIAANHPTMLETLLIPLLFFPLYLFHLRFFVWSVPDRRLLPPRLRWIFRLARCITIDRSDQNLTKHTIQAVAHVLSRNGVVIIHPEAGRTFKGETFITLGNRRMRSFVSGVPALARSAGATLLPLWVSGTDIVLPYGAWLPRFTRSRITLSFGAPYRPQQEKESRAAESLVLAQAILKS